MSKEEIEGKLDELYSNPKSRNFINHLIRSYIPESGVFPEKNVNAKCCLTSVKLNKVDGITSDSTDTYMTAQVYDVFCDWIINKYLSNDKHIKWLTSKVRKQEFVFRAEKLADTAEKKESLKLLKRAPKKKNTSGDSKSSSATFTDLGVLQELKVKMESNENKN